MTATRHSVTLRGIAAAVWLAVFQIAVAINPGKGPVCDISAAQSFCDSLPLSELEGIWKFPADNIIVLISKTPSLSSSSSTTYDISVVETSTANLHPGQIIGSLTASPASTKFDLELYTKTSKGLLSGSEKCVATLSPDSRSMTMSTHKSNFRLRTSVSLTSLLPKFWRIVRLTPTISQPTTERAPVGMIKIYPSYDGNGSSTHEPRYL